MFLLLDLFLILDLLQEILQILTVHDGQARWLHLPQGSMDSVVRCFGISPDKLSGKTLSWSFTCIFDIVIFDTFSLSFFICKFAWAGLDWFNLRRLINFQIKWNFLRDPYSGALTLLCKSWKTHPENFSFPGHDSWARPYTVTGKLIHQNFMSTYSVF